MNSISIKKIAAHLLIKYKIYGIYIQLEKDKKTIFGTIKLLPFSSLFYNVEGLFGKKTKICTRFDWRR